MDQEAIETALSEAIEEVLASLAFAFVMPGEDIPPAGEVMLAEIDFTGPFNGTLRLTIPDELSPMLAENMLGIEQEECGEEIQHDALKELLNVICGNLLPRIAGTEPVFNLSSPRIVTDEEAAESSGLEGAKSAVRLPLDEGWIGLAMRTDN